MGQRQRTVNEKAVNKTLDFLKVCQSKGMFTGAALSAFQETFHINKSTVSICKKLQYIAPMDGAFVWAVGDPDRKMAITILEALRKQSDKKADLPTLPDFAGVVIDLQRINKELSEIGESVSKRLKTPMLDRALQQSPMNGNLFSEVDKKRDDLIKIASSIAEAVYQGWSADYMGFVEKNNNFILEASQDLLNKLYNVK